MNNWEPKIVYIMCSWCGSGGAETAAAFNLKYPENIKPFRVWCTGGLDPAYILRAFFEGADGIIISGCHPGDCHYDIGNYYARRRLAALKTILKTFGFDENRIWLRWVGHSEGKRLVDTAEEFNEHIKKLGPHKIEN